ncbi:unnamed protein product [Leptidea sinapis]|uniref:Uncharacterized protein n=1 Tax=Leptidea sinapis TaxID=189913 RepID=A0A5E4PV39_9NEOP|nr:unnamed protein product [Leptidea sinapis]
MIQLFVANSCFFVIRHSILNSSKGLVLRNTTALNIVPVRKAYKSVRKVSHARKSQRIVYNVISKFPDT